MFEFKFVFVINVLIFLVFIQTIIALNDKNLDKYESGANQKSSLSKIRQKRDFKGVCTMIIHWVTVNDPEHFN